MPRFVSLVALFIATFCRAELSLEVKQITSGPTHHHFFGYIGHVQNIPWNQSERYILALRTKFQNHLPGADEPAEIVLLDTHHRFSATVIERTLAWNPQQGTMLYWNPESPETQFFFNDRDPRTGKIFTVLCDIRHGGKRIREYRFQDTPVGNSGVAQKGQWFAAINYGRLARLRAVTGYRDAYDWTRETKHPSDDGVFRINFQSGRRELLVSFQQLADALRPTRPDVDEKHLFINHTLWNRDNDRLFFFVRGDFDQRSSRINQGFVIKPDGTGLTAMKQHVGGHPEWADGHRLLGIVDGKQAVYDTDRQQVLEILGDERIFPDPEGDIALSPDGRWLVNGHREKSRNFYTFYRRKDRAWIRSEGFDVTGWTSGDLRCDPAPCWNRSGNAIVFPAIAPDGSRQMFLLRLMGG
jgi:hypothetical protein